MRWSSAILLLLVGIAGSGCAGYRAGPTNGLSAGEKSIRVNFFRNATQEPRLVEAVCTALRRNLQQDGTYRLSTRDDADIVVDGTIMHYDRSGVSFRPDDILTARDFRLIMIAKVTAIEKSSGKVLLEREVLGRTTIRFGRDLASAERQAAPLLAEDLARNTTSLLVDGQW